MLTLYRPTVRSAVFLSLYSDRVSAGFPSPASDHKEKKIDLNEELIRHPDSTYLLRAQGNSMEGAGIYDGDLMIVDRSITPTDGAIVIAVVHGDLTVKRLKITDDRYYGKVRVLAAEHPDYPDIPVQDDGCLIWGVVRHSVRDLV